MDAHFSQTVEKFLGNAPAEPSHAENWYEWRQEPDGFEMCFAEPV